MRYARAAFALSLLYGAYWAFRLAWADYLFASGDPVKMRRAALLAPWNAGYQLRIGNLRRALDLNPYLSPAWMELGIEAESQGNFAEAERCLLQAAAVDQTFEPRWTLANFYFRRQRADAFWKWLQLAAARSYGDRSAIFRLAWRMTDKPGEILDRGLTRDVGMLAAYLTFLLAEGKLDAAIEESAALLPQATVNERDLLLGFCEKLIAAERRDAAVSTWNGLIARNLIPYGPLDVEGGISLTNRTLAIPPLGQCFDWRMLWRANIHSAWSPGQRQIRVTLTGKQEEHTELVAQIVPIVAEAAYRFRYRYRTEGLGKDSGVHWRVGTGAPGVSLSNPEWREEVLTFHSPSRLIRIALTYDRAPGTVRQEGTVVLDGAFALERMQPR
ncbi:MAG TPA: hypothetical protein VM120_13030 [Bryobacteraceae bacterium]|nr:hypothetical protein [Bryobacteraceae bacterium]